MDKFYKMLGSSRTGYLVRVIKFAQIEQFFSQVFVEFIGRFKPKKSYKIFQKFECFIKFS